MEASTDYFILLVECNRVLYDKNSKDFKNVVKKDEAWARIARNTKMTVEAAKKKYTLLRQKYCREKQKIEIQRRTKAKPSHPWIYYDRFHFLDEYIRPRTTYSNDTGFEDMGGSSTHPGDDTSGVTEMEGINDQDVYGKIDTNDGASNQPIIQYDPEDLQDQNMFQIVDISEEVPIIVVSQYSGEKSTHFPPAERHTIESDDVDVRPTSSSTIADKTRSFTNPSRDDDEELLPARENSETNSSLTLTKTVRILQSSSQDVGFQSTRENVSTTKKAPAAKPNTDNGRNIPKTVEPAPTPASMPSNVQDIDSLRRKLDSCISSLSTKISEKNQRSPHAPFLAYLGTKLPNVPKKELPVLEKRILDLVDSSIH